MLETRAAGPDTSLGITVRLGVTRMLDRRTQCMVLSASIKHSVYRDATPDPRSMLGVGDVEKIVADGEGDVVVGRRSRHRADVLGHRPQGPDSRRCHQRAAPCPLARVLAASSARRSAPSELFQPYVTQMYHVLVQRANEEDAALISV